MHSYRQLTGVQVHIGIFAPEGDLGIISDQHSVEAFQQVTVEELQAHVALGGVWEGRP